MTLSPLDPHTQKVVDDFDTLARRRASELLPEAGKLRETTETAFCLGYKAATVDLGTSLRETHGVSLDQLLAVYAAACTWRDHSGPDGPERYQLIVAIDAARRATRDADG